MMEQSAIQILYSVRVLTRTGVSEPPSRIASGENNNCWHDVLCIIDVSNCSLYRYNICSRYKPTKQWHAKDNPVPLNCSYPHADGHSLEYLLNVYMHHIYEEEEGWGCLIYSHFCVAPEQLSVLLGRSPRASKP